MVRCDALLRERGGTVVGVVAGPEVGKTTMIGTIYELIHRGRMPTIGFAGSETLRGYEERCHRSRMRSNGMKADTPRTRTSEQLSFTHLRVATAAGIKDIVFSDRSGEHFDNVLHRPAEIGNFAELTRANTILLLVDLQQLLISPHQPTSQIRRLFMAMEQNGLLVGKPLILVGTKSDLLRADRDAENARGSFEELKNELGSRANGRVQLEATLVASRAPHGTSHIGTGLEALVGNLLREAALRKFHIKPLSPEKPTELDLLMNGFRSNR